MEASVALIPTQSNDLHRSFDNGFTDLPKFLFHVLVTTKQYNYSTDRA